MDCLSAPICPSLSPDLLVEPEQIERGHVILGMLLQLLEVFAFRLSDLTALFGEQCEVEVREPYSGLVATLRE